MVFVETYPNSVPVVSVDGINGSLSAKLELNYTPSMQGVGINTSEYGPLNFQQFCPSATQLQEL